MTYQISLKVGREKYIIAPPFTDDELPTFIEGSKKITNMTFTADVLPTFTEGRQRIYHSTVVH